MVISFLLNVFGKNKQIVSDLFLFQLEEIYSYTDEIKQKVSKSREKKDKERKYLIECMNDYED